MKLRWSKSSRLLQRVAFLVSFVNIFIKNINIVEQEYSQENTYVGAWPTKDTVCHIFAIIIRGQFFNKCQILVLLSKGQNCGNSGVKVTKIIVITFILLLIFFQSSLNTQKSN